MHSRFPMPRFASTFAAPDDAHVPLHTNGNGHPSKRRYRAIWISDLHLGTRGCKAELLLEFLEQTESDYLYLVGDVIDGWALRKSWNWNELHDRVVRRILKKTSRTRVAYVCGNHDAFLRGFLGHTFGGVRLTDAAVHEMVDGRRLLVLHGDHFDAAIRHAPWLAHLGDRAYRASLVLNTAFNFVRARLGFPYWSLSAWLEHKVKDAVSYIASFEHALLDEARRKGFHGVVCGHIHHAAIREEGGLVYCNDGDWVESCTALVEHASGKLEIVRWNDVREAQAARLEEALA